MKTERTLLTIEFKNGNTFKKLVENVFFEEGSLYHIPDNQIRCTIVLPVKTPMENIESFEIKKVMCDGWKIIEMEEA